MLALLMKTSLLVIGNWTLFKDYGGNWLGPTGGDIVTGLPASSLFVYSGYPAVARFITDQKVRVVE